MKILIIASPRSGSTTLFNALHKNLNNYKGFCEPFSLSSESLGDPNDEYSLNYPNLLIKLLPWDLNHHFYFRIIDGFFQYNTYSLDEIKNLMTSSLHKYSFNFNKVILLARKNKLEQAQSYSFASNTKNSYHVTYEYKDNFQDLSRSLNFIKNHDDVLMDLSNSLKIPLTYYEDLFQNDILKIQNFLNQNKIEINNFQLFCNMLNSKNRYRQF